MDTNQDGVLNLEEVKAGMKEAGLSKMHDIQAIFDTLDADKSGTIGYTEFLASLIDQKQYKKTERLRDAFRIFDKNGDGSISLQELIEMLKDPTVTGKAQDEEEAKRLFDQVDTDGNGLISFEEFEAMMKT